MRNKKLVFELVLILLVSFLAIGCVGEKVTEGYVEEQQKEGYVEEQQTEGYVEEQQTEEDIEEQQPDNLLTTYSENIPSSVYSLYPKLGDYLLSYEITNNGEDYLYVTVSSEITGYTDDAINTKQISPGETVEISQTPLFKPGVLDTLTETKTANLHFKVTYVEDNVEKVWDEQTMPIELYSKDTMVWSTYYDGELVDLSPYIVAWVTPHTREIDELVRIAAEYNPQGTMGYARTSDERYAQINAIYDALQNEYSITYISSPISYTSGMESSQRVKLPKDAINLASANCIDGTVLFASALENIGIDSDIVIIPGHAFLAWEDGEGNIEGALETTMVGNSDFYDAYTYGLDEYNEQVENGNFENGISLAISVKKCRDLGITPME
ncbi:hypothetical protein [Methanosarcina sp. 1.H.A.2.2]|uniref:hypothetical protein n=1 Tax=Methanosarcina sp. 1.H.A.2.2 TaxID=1483601 RepID=UPI000621C368|nr:hypothetical protein [Methanosarcina sp. 1.H.A.2.2]KKH46543.1 hypothetical protein EO93_04170 [Methanosarcina sp. 1.H.A.2.2]